MPSGVYKRTYSRLGQKQQEMIGQKFRRLLVLKYDNEISEQKRHDYYLCRCDCGVELVISGNFLRRKHTQSCGCLRQDEMRKIGKQKRRDQTNENGPGYIDGLSRGCRKRIEFRESIRHRDNYECQRCNKTQEQELIDIGKKLSVHHKDGNEYNDIPENTITYCFSCHSMIENELRKKEPINVVDRYFDAC